MVIHCYSIRIYITAALRETLQVVLGENVMVVMYVVDSYSRVFLYQKCLEAKSIIFTGQIRCVGEFSIY